MKSKNKLLFLTNIVNPYQLDLFDSLSQHYSLSVVYFSETEKDRSWRLTWKSARYDSIILKDGFLNLCVQKISHDLYFQLSLIPYLLKFSGTRIVISGSYYSPNTWVALFISKIRRKKVYWMGDQINPRVSTLKKTFKKLFLWPLFSLLDGLLAIGHVALASYRDHGYRGPITVVSHSINCQRFDGDRKSKEGFIKIVMPGSLIYRKGIDIGIKAFLEALKRVGESCELRVIGDGPLMSQFKNAYRDCPQIKFLGFKNPEDVDQELLSADIFLFSTRYDSWGVVVNEAIAAGTPLIVSDRCGASELVGEQSGFVCESENISEFTDALVRLISNPCLRDSMSAHNLKMRYQYSSDNVAEMLYRFIC
jgi:glycosyltransferase involved in cell wall biosynthesis